MDLRFPDASFRADPGRRLLSGLLVPWNVPTRSGGQWYVFQPDSLYWSNVSRVKLNRGHNLHDAIGVATELHSTSAGLEGSFRVATGDDGDATLKLAAEGVTDGFSVEVTWTDDGDRVEDSPHIVAGKRVQVVSRAALRGVALVAYPAYDDARVWGIAASRDGRLEIRLDADLEEGVKAAADRSGTSVSELVRGQLRHFTSQRPVYPLTGSGPSLLADLWTQNHPTEGDSFAAAERLEGHRRFMREMQATFATATRATDPELIPPGYRPLLAGIESDRPLFEAASHGDLSTPTPFVVPGNIDETAIDTGVAAHVEGTQPTEGTLSLTQRTVTPAGVSGKFSVTREIADASSPQADAIVFALMREDFDRQVETLIYTELNGSGGQGGTITGDFVPSGAAVRTSTGAALPADLRKALGLFVDHRKQKARSVVASSRKAVSEALEALDMTAWALRDVTVELSPWITGTAAGDGDVFILGRNDLWCWESPLLEFSYRERSGPALVDLSLFAYVAVRLIRPQGLAAIRHT